MSTQHVVLVTTLFQSGLGSEVDWRLILDTARYVVALFWVVAFPFVVFWFLVHPFTRFWRRIGPIRAYVVLLLFVIVLAIGAYRLREHLLAVEFGTNMALWPFAILSYALDVWIEIQCYRHLRISTLFGLPELRQDQSKRPLLTKGLYARIRHPRYVGAFFSITACALFSNYLTLYFLVPALAIILHLITVLEERELIGTFGEAYKAYRRRVPRFVPRLRS